MHMVEIFINFLLIGAWYRAFFLDAMVEKILDTVGLVVVAAMIFIIVASQCWPLYIPKELNGVQSTGTVVSFKF
jgi:hypothetical protein